MTDKPETLPITDPHRVPVVFFNNLVGSGHLNGVANLTLAVANFSPSPGGAVLPDMVVAARLRTDLFGLQQLRDACDAILQQNLKPAGATTN